MNPIRTRRRSPRLSNLFTLLVAVVLLGGAAWVAARLEPDPPRLEGRARASDGDSIRFGETRVRLLGLDAPERDQTCTDAQGAEWRCGEAASQRMSALLAGGNTVCVVDGRDRYGRHLARCTTQGRDLAAVMVSEGLAISEGEYGHQEATARRNRSGIWAGRFTSPREWRAQKEDKESLLDWMLHWIAQLTGATIFR